MFPKIVGFSPQIIHFKRVFHYKPFILGYPYFWKHSYSLNPSHIYINQTVPYPALIVQVTEIDPPPLQRMSGMRTRRSNGWTYRGWNWFGWVFFTTHFLWDPWKNGIFPYMNGWFFMVFSCKEIYQATMDPVGFEKCDRQPKLDHLFPQVVWGEHFSKNIWNRHQGVFFFSMTIGKPRKNTNCQQKMEIWVNYICCEIG